jgi:hypothetical protein
MRITRKVLVYSEENMSQQFWIKDYGNINNARI